MLRVASLRLARAAAASAAAFATASALRAASAEEAEKKEKPKPCLQMTLIPDSTVELLRCYQPEYSRIVADRVLIRPCMTEEMDACPLRPLAVVEDGSSQSLLIVPAAPLWVGAADISNSGRVGSPVLPISIPEEEEPPAKPAPPPPPPPEPVPAAAATAAAEATTAPPPPAPPPPAAAAAEEEAPQPPTLWEQIEEPWRLLEASGVLSIERDADSMPTKVSLSDGAVAWQGDVPDGANSTRRVTVRLIDEAASARLNLRGRTRAPECGFCRFMKDGPCGDVFIAWEACVDMAKEESKDFVEACGQPTLKLKACTDAHPEYYGALNDDAPEDKEEEKK